MDSTRRALPQSRRRGLVSDVVIAMTYSENSILRAAGTPTGIVSHCPESRYRLKAKHYRCRQVDGRLVELTTKLLANPFARGTFICRNPGSWIWTSEVSPFRRLVIVTETPSDISVRRSPYGESYPHIVIGWNDDIRQTIAI